MNVIILYGIIALLIFICMALFMFIILLAKKTHAIVEFKSLMGKNPIGLFFRRDGQVEWKLIKPKSGMVIDKDYGAFILNETGNYVDMATKNVVLPFDTDFGQNISMEVYNSADQFKKVIKDPEKLKLLRAKIVKGEIKNSKFDFIKQSVDLRSLKHLMTVQTPQIIEGLVEKLVAERTRKDAPNPFTLLFIFLGGLGTGYITTIVMMRFLGS